MDIMLDIETLGTGGTPVILSVGAVPFEEGGIRDHFYCNVDPQNCVEQGCQMDLPTIEWWIQQESCIYAALLEDRLPLRKALKQFADFVSAYKRPFVWSNGLNFDIRIMRNLYDLLDIKCPWHYRDERDMRTALDMGKRAGVVLTIDRMGVHHNALDDAVYQANVVREIFSQLTST